MLLRRYYNIVIGKENVITKNVDTIAAQSQNVFKCTNDKISKTQCFYCISNFVPYYYKSYVYQIAIECFNSNVESKIFSSALKEKVIYRW